MFESFKKWLDENREYGLTLWYAYDPITKKPSITLFMSYCSFLLSIVAGIATLFFPQLVVPAIAIYTFTTVMVILYMIRAITKAKFDLDDKSFEISNEEKENK